MPLVVEVGLSPGHSVLDGDAALPPKKGGTPPILVHVYCAKTAGWKKMPLGMKVGLDPSDIVLDLYPAPPPQKRGQRPPVLGP